MCYSTRYVSYKDIKALMADLKLVYQAVTEDETLNNLVNFKETWGKAYPSYVKSWENNWDVVLNQLNIMFSEQTA
nr:transposase [Sedimentibacter sp. zth1]